MKYFVDVIKPIIVNTFHEAVHGQGTWSHLVQMEANPANSGLLRYVPPSAVAQIAVGTAGQIMPNSTTIQDFAKS